MSVIPAATVILVREGERGLEVFLVRRHKKSTFMSNAFVFPGGKIDAADGSAEVAAVRELFEEAGVLLALPRLEPGRLARERARLLAGEIGFAELLLATRLAPDVGRLHWWARWITPATEPRRFDAQFFIAELPREQVPSYDRLETVEELWITPAAALVKQAAGELRLAPPQLRTFHELAAIEGGVRGVLAAAEARGARRVAICPRIVQDDGSVAIVLPWDPGYRDAPSSDPAEPIPPDHPLATPPSRFVWNGTAWRAM